MLEEFKGSNEFYENYNSIIQTSKIDWSEFDIFINDKINNIFWNLLKDDDEHYIVTPQEIAEVDISSGLTETEVKKFPKLIQTIKDKLKNRSER